MTGAILSVKRLAWTIGVPLKRLLAIEQELKADYTQHYRFFALPTGKGTVRHIRPPRDELMAIQRRIVKAVLQPLGLHDAAHGGVAGRSPSTNAICHAGQRTVLKVDVKKFFDNVDHRRVHHTLRSLGFGRDVARLLTRLLTLRRSLPQGAASSPAVANLFASTTIDAAVDRLGPELGLLYTRFVDDLTLSGDEPQEALPGIARALSREGLRINRKKLAITPNSVRQEVTGLITNNPHRLTVSRDRRSAVRAAIFQIRAGEPTANELEKRTRSIKGRIVQIERLHAGEGRRLRRYLETMLAR